MSIKAIIFDFGEVLNVLDDPAEDETRRAELGKRLNLETEEVWSCLFEGPAARRWFRGDIDRQTFWNEVLGNCGISDPAEIQSISSTVFEGRQRVNPEMASLAQELSARYKLAVLSNTGWSEAEMKHLMYNDFGLPADLFDVIVTSHSARITKPDPAIFRLALERLGTKPEETIFTDDVESYTKAAAKLGLHTHTFTRPSALRDYLLQIGVL